MMHARPVLVITIASLVAGTGNAQDLASDLKAMAAATTTATRYSARIFVRVVDSTGNGILSRDIRTIRDGAHFHYDADSITLLVTPSGTVMVDHGRRTIAYSRNDGATPPQPGVPDVGSVLAGLDSVSLVHESTKTRRYVMYKGSGEIRRSELIIDVESHLPLEVIFNYDAATADAITARIRYDWQLGIVNDPHLLRLDSFVRSDGRTVTAAPAYATYRMIQAAP